MIYMMDCAYRSQWIMAEILSQHEGELDLFRGWGGCLCLWSRTITPPSLFSIHHTMIGGCLLVEVEVVIVVEGEVVAAVVVHHTIVLQLGDVS